MIMLSGTVARIAVPLVAVLGAGTLPAQGVVGGRLTLVERPGERTTDLANAVVYVVPRSAAAGKPGAGSHRIVMEGRRFTPHVQVATVGSSVEFPNNDPFRHNVFSKSGPSEFDLGLYGRGDTRGTVVRRAGVFPIFCNIHARMVAFVVAVATPFHTQAGADGRFAIQDVPPGAYTLHVWHDRGGEYTREIDVPAGGVSNLSVQLDARGYRFVQHRNKFGQEYSPASRDRY